MTFLFLHPPIANNRAGMDGEIQVNDQIAKNSAGMNRIQVNDQIDRNVKQGYAPTYIANETVIITHSFPTQPIID